MTAGVREWKPETLYVVGELVEYRGVLYRVRCPEHGDDCG